MSSPESDGQESVGMTSYVFFPVLQIYLGFSPCPPGLVPKSQAMAAMTEDVLLAFENCQAWVILRVSGGRGINTTPDEPMVLLSLILLSYHFLFKSLKSTSRNIYVSQFFLKWKAPERYVCCLAGFEKQYSGLARKRHHGKTEVSGCT
jgi:hypothetical protein